MPSDDRIALISGSHSGAHLTDDQLMETYVQAADNRHLTACRQCQVRFDDLARALEQIREDAVREADSMFSVERLHDQRDRILRRLERQGHPAEVLLFPERSAQPQAARRVFGPARRWIAAAAAAGLAAGLFLGFAMDRRVTSRAAGRVAQTPPVLADARLWPASTADARNEQMLLEIEEALIGPRHVLELRALDVITTPPEILEASLDPR